MSCCGSQRSALRAQAPTASPTRTHHWASRAVDFEHTGTGALTVTGPLTGTVYRFSGPGARVRVHGADAPSLVSVPGLRLVR
jgi:hypothetical protein